MDVDGVDGAVVVCGRVVGSAGLGHVEGELAGAGCGACVRLGGYLGGWCEPGAAHGAQAGRAGRRVQQAAATRPAAGSHAAASTSGAG